MNILKIYVKERIKTKRDKCGRNVLKRVGNFLSILLCTYFLAGLNNYALSKNGNILLLLDSLNNSTRAKRTRGEGGHKKLKTLYDAPVRYTQQCQIHLAGQWHVYHRRQIHNISK